MTAVEQEKTIFLRKVDYTSITPDQFRANLHDSLYISLIQPPLVIDTRITHHILDDYIDSKDLSKKVTKLEPTPVTQALTIPTDSAYRSRYSIVIALPGELRQELSDVIVYKRTGNQSFMEIPLSTVDHTGRYDGLNISDERLESLIPFTLVLGKAKMPLIYRIFQGPAMQQMMEQYINHRIAA